MIETVSALLITQVKQIAEQQKKLNRQITMFNIWSIWACAFLILSVYKSYRNLNGVNPNHVLLAMNIIFLFSLFSKFILWKRNSIQQLNQSKLGVVILVLKQHLKNQRNLILNNSITFIILLCEGLAFYLLYIPDTSILFWIVITPVSVVVFVFSCLFIKKIKHIQTQINRMFPEYIYDFGTR